MTSPHPPRPALHPWLLSWLLDVTVCVFIPIEKIAVAVFNLVYICVNIDTDTPLPHSLQLVQTITSSGQNTLYLHYVYHTKFSQITDHYMMHMINLNKKVHKEKQDAASLSPIRNLSQDQTVQSVLFLF